ncbi:outer membrane protein assembly factor [Deinococcus psychrotolerans]|uniref:Outer membrane protein assembly factor n=1 Tax=Deinococcus psychrotolerans TaxID=2489213 RepID=A0A3G8Y8E6_9DEIO|nr:POTRA domain-containing protein [Deinococcus psychrotolerans]AZI41455.1 outer membrane protein assembly factor [Deinococcus psychrotolerans]
MKHPLTLALSLALAAPLAAAQSTTPAAPAAVQAANLGDVVVTGAPDLLGNFLKASLTVQRGAALSGLNLRQIEQEALATGYFSSVTASLGTQDGQNVLTLAVKPNPVLSAVEVQGLTYFPADTYKARIADLLNIAPGATLNTDRVDQSKELLAQNFRGEGYPFVPSISTKTTPAADGSVTLTYVVDETAPLSRVEIEGNTRLPRDSIVNAFKPLYDAKKFTPEVYFKAAQDIAQAYQAAGFLQSGIDVSATTLDKGVLKIKLTEGVVSKVDTSILGSAVSAAGLLTKEGTPLTLSTLEADTRTLSNQTGKSVGFALQPDAQNPSQVTVVFGDAQTASGPIKEIRFVGNTKLTAAELQAALKLKVGDVFSQQLAESSFFALRDAYRAAGYEISTRDPIAFDSGVLTYTIHETSAAKFELSWTGAHRTQDRVILRELQNLTGVVSSASIRDGLDRVTRLGIVKVTNLTTRSDDPKNPEVLTYVINLTEQSSTRSVPFGISYDTVSGFQGSLGLSNNNVFGLGHTLEASVTAQPTDSGQFLGGGVNYTIPWLDIDFADFRKTPTSVSLSLSSTLSPNNGILNTDSSATGRQFTQRSSGISVRVGRSLAKYLTGSVGVGTSYDVSYLEKITDADQKTADDAGKTLIDDAAATALLPESGLITRLSPALNYDSTNSGDFPTQGIRANFSPSYNFGSAGSNSLSWFKLEGGASTYYGFGKTLEKGFNQQSKQQVLAARVNAGTLTGNYPVGSTFGIGDASIVSAYELRGIPTGTLKGSSYVTGSAEYRYDFGVSNSIAQGLYGIAFVDAGSAFAANGTSASAYGLGLGVQLNLGIGGALLPALRFDYGFSPSNNSSKFSFRIGPVF